ncbi:NAD(P)-dependent dehydrogenase (short-subunit alcohol dehydrogenase family) [Lipingzhangella halophila]|uniref:NAD(P)-dependent dehydrogenase (Short-subunit alcohol dehydrogenase family) n=1 Tax=Lipingzhangella halophila TaxID=1783352 RepID=A0A7W7RJG0_9ACTN|nr:SDR family NAD(P)-dependent oxidoreductase [Lipingzhangella halophila]MBB4932708.1 NAD(P)-dependent dehydrogenase (short-subunit alcohol dehydrogenase family) [Lipingzhangella halophila]
MRIVWTAVAGAALATAAYRARKRRPVADLRGRTVLVTGGSRGLGLLLARGFGAAGCRVVICARDDDELQRALKDLSARDIDAHGLVCDLRDPAETATMVERASGSGGLDIVVNNAGEIQVAPVDATTRGAFESAMGAMFWGPRDVADAALPHLRERGGTLVNITSIGGKVSPPHLLPYSCAKFAQVALSEGLDAELSKSGVRVLTVVPGLMRTGSHRRAVFSGAPAREYTWFALGASLPLVSMSGERAASRIVEAVRCRQRYLVLHPLTRAAMATHGAFPRLTLMGLRTMNRVLPESAGEPATSGLDASARADNALLRALTRLNDRASERLNQFVPTDPRRDGEGRGPDVSRTRQRP